MKKRLISLALVALIGLSVAIPALAVSYATIVGGWLRLRSGPSYSATVIASYRSGTVVTVLGGENGWSYVQTPDFRMGYMDSRYLNYGLNPDPPAPTPTPVTRTWTEVNQTAYITSRNGRGVRLRNAPAVTSTNVIGLYPVGRTVLEIRRSSDGWSYIRIDRKNGYMMSQYLTTAYQPVYPIVEPTKTIQPGLPFVTAEPGSTSVIVEEHPKETPTPTPAPQQQFSVKVDPYQPTVGDTMKVIVTPSGAQYSVIWYNEQGTLLSTNRTYRISASDEGHIINVRVIGLGDYSGLVADGRTGTVKAAE